MQNKKGIACLLTCPLSQSPCVFLEEQVPLVLQFLNKLPTSCISSVSFYVSARVIELILESGERELIETLKRKCEEGIVDLFCGLAYEPALTLLTDDKLDEHSEAYRALAGRAGLSVNASLWLMGDSIPASILHGIARREIRHVVLCHPSAIAQGQSCGCYTFPFKETNSEVAIISSAPKLKEGQDLKDRISEQVLIVCPDQVGQLLSDKTQENNFLAISALLSQEEEERFKPRFLEFSSADKCELWHDFWRNFQYQDARLQKLREAMENQKISDEVKPRLSAARKALLKANNYALLDIHSQHGVLSITTRKVLEKELLSAQVELDYVEYGNIDPKDGWVHWKIEAHQNQRHRGLDIDTQLMSMKFDLNAHGSLSHWSYKAQKTSLTSVAPRPGDLQGQSTNCQLFVCQQRQIPQELNEETLWPASESEEATVLTTRNTPGLVSIRLTRPAPSLAPLVLSSSPMVSSEFSFRSGIGAHLNHATTGFCAEYWLEPSSFVPSAGSDKEPLFFLWTFLYTPPSDDKGLLSCRPLLCVGGAGEHAVTIDRTVSFALNNTPGGPYGLRIIDGGKTFVVDFRWTKPLESASASPVYLSPKCESDQTQGSGESKLFQGIRISFVQKIRNLFQEDKPATLFVSMF